MNMCLKKLLVVILVFCASIFFMTASVMAAPPGLPQATYAGGFNYDATAGTLDFTGLALGTITYTDGSQAFPWAFDPYNDPLVKEGAMASAGYLNLGTFQQDVSNQNLFHATSSSNLSVTSVDFMGNPVATYFTGDLNSFEVINDAGGWHFNLDYDLYNISNVASTGQTGSEFADEFVTNAAYDGNNANLSMSFTFSSGTDGFTPEGANTSGSVDGIIAAPEPVSSVLFIVGSTVLAARRFRKKTSIA